MLGGGEKAGEPDVGNPLNGGIRVLRGIISIGVGEVVWRFDRAVSGAGLGEPVCSEDWKSLYEMTSGQTKVTTSYDRE